MLEALANELPSGTVRYSSKVVLIEESGFFKFVHLADGEIIKAKVKKPHKSQIYARDCPYVDNLFDGFCIRAYIYICCLSDPDKVPCENENQALIGCDGVNSVVAKWLGFKKPAFTGRSAIRGMTNFENRHGLEPLFMQFFGHGVRSGAMPCDDKSAYWFFTWAPSTQGKKKPMHIYCGITYFPCVKNWFTFALKQHENINTDAKANQYQFLFLACSSVKF